MRVLLVKLSSMGDVLHALPAVTDAHAHLGELQLDWVIEEGFAEIPTWHPGVNRVLQVATRRWRRHPWEFRDEIGKVRRQMTSTEYDLVIDAQGLMKSAVIAATARGKTVGFDRLSVREPLASVAYRVRVAVDKKLHAIDRQRELFARALGYELSGEILDYGIDKASLPVPRLQVKDPYIVLLHGTTWPSKRWSKDSWLAAGLQATAEGFQVLLPWSGEAEKKFVTQLANELNGALVLPRLSLAEVCGLLSRAAGAIATDTGLGHLAAALGVPCVSIYGATDPGLTGSRGQNQAHAPVQFDCAPCLARQCFRITTPAEDPPCYETVSPDGVWSTLRKLMPPGLVVE